MDLEQNISAYTGIRRIFHKPVTFYVLSHHVQTRDSKVYTNERYINIQHNVLDETRDVL